MGCLPVRPLTARLCRAALAAGGALAAIAGPGPVSAQAPVVDDTPAQSQVVWALGGSLARSPTYSGSSAQKWQPGLLWALRRGRYRIGTSGASGLLASAGDIGSGASADLVIAQRWKFGAALRFDNGRRSSEDPALTGQPDVRRTLRGRVYAGVDLGDGWGAALGWSVDLLGRGGGSTGSLDLSHSWPLPDRPGASFSVGGGMALADARYLASYYGVSPAVAQATGRPVFTPSAGPLDLHLGAGLRVPLGPHWMLMSGLGIARLQGDAAASPWTQRPNSWSASVGLAWRSK